VQRATLAGRELVNAANGTRRFAALLRTYRTAAGLSQDELAERAGLSRRGISDLERGTRRKPYPETIRRLADALDLDQPARMQLQDVGRRASHSMPQVDTGPEPPVHQGIAAPLTSFVGRERELESVRRLVASSRLVTLVGTGGVGKTRLALEVVRALVPDYPGEVYVVELAPLADPALVGQAVAAALNVEDRGGRSAVELLISVLRDRRVLLVLDNCEHLIRACGELVRALLSACPELRILATSREPLRLAGEWRWRVPSLSVPDTSTSPVPEQLRASEAVRLFVERAQAVRPDFEETEDDMQLVGDICRRLDGIPLAIELAAPLVGALSLEQIAEHLEDRFALLTSGTREALPRHQTLRAMVDWSYDLLEAPQRTLLQRLSVFAGGWTLDAAERVCAGEEIQAHDVVRQLVRLVDQSLVVVDIYAGAARYRLPETLRQYARERLLASGTAGALRHQHALFFTGLAEQADDQLRGSGQQLWRARLDGELDNLRAALSWWTDRGEAESGLRLAGALGWFWYQHSHLVEGRGWCERILALRSPASPTPDYRAARVRTLFGAGVLALQQGDFALARAWHDEGLQLAREDDDVWGIAWSLQGLGHTYARTGQLAEARAYLYDCLARWRALGHRWGEAFSLNWLGNAAYMEGDLEAAWDFYVQALGIRQEIGDRYATANTFEVLGRVRRGMGEHAAACALFEQARALFRDLGHPQGVARAQLGLGRLACAQGDPAAAVALLSEALRLFKEVADHVGIAEVLEAIAALAATCRPARSAGLFGASESLRTQMHYFLAGSERVERDIALGAIRTELSDEAFRVAWDAGELLDLSTAVKCAEEELSMAGSSDADDARSHAARS
jgi:predicted ATPase/transcriptional regulator with XRE-family HTH domain